MNTYMLYAPCHFGLEAVLKKEIIDIGYEPDRVEDGRIFFTGDAEAIARCNIGLRTAERIMLLVGEFRATTYEELFQGIKGLDLEKYIPSDGKFWVTKATSIKSKLFSPSDIQSVAKKAMVERLKGIYHMDLFPETGAQYPMRISIMKDMVTVGIDTTGESLHKRGYRVNTVKAPISETLAAALIMLTPWKPDRILVDPFCGSGTFTIEAAMMAAGMAPGMNRSFMSQSWNNLIDTKIWDDAFEEAREAVNTDIDVDIQGYDIDDAAIKAARDNAVRAGVDKLIHLQVRSVDKLAHPKKYGFIICNPPYGERLEDKKDLPELYKTIGDRYRALDSWSMYLITSYEDAERYIGSKADKNRKLYNGMIKTYYYQYMGPKPSKRSSSEK